MALPGFYNQGDQEIYESGNKFIPQEQYRLGYTHPPSATQEAGAAGITNTNVAQPFIWPPQEGGGGGGGFSNTNKFGLNLDTMKTISQGKYVEQGGPANMYGGDYVKTDRQIAQDEHGNWKDVNTNKNVYHGNINLKTPMTMIMDKLSGKKTTDDPYKDSWYGADWNQEDEDAGLYSRTIGPKNLIQRWKIKRDIKKQEKIAEDKAAADAVAAQTLGPNNPLIGKIDHTGGGITREPGSVVEGAPTHSTRDDLMAQGGRIGYRWGESVDPEEPAENIFQIMQEENIPFSEQVEGGPTEDQVAMVRDMDGRQMGIDEIVSLTGLGKEVVLSILGVDMAQGGIARLL